jgi:8-oxo-dGTP pyrophosphatase MutT (NUDIX family)
LKDRNLTDFGGIKTMQNFLERLKLELSKELPGKEVQWLMAPKHRINDLPDSPGKDTLNAAVLILLYPLNDSIYTVMIQRQSYDGVHSAQISFPGGKNDLSDESNIHTALREAQEEIGIYPPGITIIGTLTPLFIPVSDFLVTPVIGWIPEKPAFSINTKEVDFLINANLNRLLNPALVRVKSIEVRGRIIEARYFDYENNMIWGATAMILQELLTIIKTAGLSLPAASEL